MVFIGLLVRLVCMVLFKSYLLQVSPTDSQNWGFGFEMGRVARAVAAGEGFSSPFLASTGPSAWVPPAYPALLAVVFRTFGTYSLASAVVILFLNSLFSALTCGLIFVFGRQVLGEKPAKWAGWAWAFFPPAVFFSIVWVWETTLSAMLVIAIFWAAWRAKETSSTSAWVIWGCVCGLGVLTNTAIAIIVPGLFVWAIVFGGYRPRRWLPAVCGALAFVLVLLPWTLRNYHQFGRLVPVRSNFWAEVRVGNPADARLRGGWTGLHPAQSEHALDRFVHLGEIGFVAEQKKEALRVIAENPHLFLWRTLKRVIAFWTGVWGRPRGIAGMFEMAEYSLLSVLSFAGIWIIRRDHPANAVLFGMSLLVFPVVYYITHCYPRYRHPVEPILVLLAACTFLKLLEKLRS